VRPRPADVAGRRDPGRNRLGRQRQRVGDGAAAPGS
jgi:hypothetical protein